MNEHETRLRDEFALIAFKQLMGRWPGEPDIGLPEVREQLAWHVWALADVMVEARSKGYGQAVDGQATRVDGQAPRGADTR